MDTLRTGRTEDTARGENEPLAAKPAEECGLGRAHCLPAELRLRNPHPGRHRPCRHLRSRRQRPVVRLPPRLPRQDHRQDTSGHRIGRPHRRAPRPGDRRLCHRWQVAHAARAAARPALEAPRPRAAHGLPRAHRGGPTGASRSHPARPRQAPAHPRRPARRLAAAGAHEHGSSPLRPGARPPASRGCGDRRGWADRRIPDFNNSVMLAPSLAASAHNSPVPCRRRPSGEKASDPRIRRLP